MSEEGNPHPAEPKAGEIILADGAPPAPIPEPGGALQAFDELLKAPHQVALRARQAGSNRPAFLLLAGSVVGFAVYGAVAGLFTGGSQVLVSAFKAPLIVLLSLALCLPSLYIFSALAGAPLSRRPFLHVVAGFSGMLALLLIGLMPISWLFSVSSRSLLFVVWLHAIAWIVAASFGARFLSRSFDLPEVGKAIFLWLLLFALVSFQVSTWLRPVLWRAPGAPIFESGKLFFLEHLDKIANPPPPAKKPAAPTAPKK
ncbi:MAG TPA: hypothetical protein VFE33_10140 [Thermoanaerobaculia bacterium]|nr:hypothetical protein [Thermoanaerobaculia bacterium]